MSNMSYCRFQNTLADLRDCHEEMSMIMDYDNTDLSPEEQRALKSLIKLCKQIAGSGTND